MLYTGLALGSNLREFPHAALYAVAGYGHFDKHITVCELFVPSEGSYFLNSPYP